MIIRITIENQITPDIIHLEEIPEYFMDFEAETIFVKTVRDIKAGEELTINYNGDWNDSSKVWFDVH